MHIERLVQTGVPVAFGVLTTDTWRLTPGDPEGREYADGLARGVAEEFARMDAGADR